MSPLPQDLVSGHGIGCKASVDLLADRIVLPHHGHRTHRWSLRTSQDPKRLLLSLGSRLRARNRQFGTRLSLCADESQHCQHSPHWKHSLIGLKEGGLDNSVILCRQLIRDYFDEPARHCALNSVAPLRGQFLIIFLSLDYFSYYDESLVCSKFLSEVFFPSAYTMRFLDVSHFHCFGRHYSRITATSCYKLLTIVYLNQCVKFYFRPRIVLLVLMPRSIFRHMLYGKRHSIETLFFAFCKTAAKPHSNAPFSERWGLLEERLSFF